jgi:hypothetical protein
LGHTTTRKEKERKMSEGFKGFSKPADDKKFRLYIRNNEVNKLIKEYKKLKKYQKSSIFEIEKLSGQETRIDKLIREYGIDSEAIE